MSLAQNAKKISDVVATLLVIAAAGTLLYTQVSGRSLRSIQRSVEDVEDLSIDASKIRLTRGAGPVAVVEFTDYQCPFCGQYARNTSPRVDVNLVDTGMVRHVVLNFPLESIHENAKRASEAAECAARQGRFFEMYRRLFSAQDALNPAGLTLAAETIGLDPAEFARCMNSQSQDIIAGDIAEARRLGVDSTPTIFVGVVQPDNSIKLMKRIRGAIPYEDLQPIVTEVASKGPRRQTLLSWF